MNITWAICHQSCSLLYPLWIMEHGCQPAAEFNNWEEYVLPNCSLSVLLVIKTLCRLIKANIQQSKWNWINGNTEEYLHNINDYIYLFSLHFQPKVLRVLYPIVSQLLTSWFVSASSIPGQTYIQDVHLGMDALYTTPIMHAVTFNQINGNKWK